MIDGELMENNGYIEPAIGEVENGTDLRHGKSGKAERDEENA